MTARSRPLPLGDLAARLSEADRACLSTLARLRTASASQLYRLCYREAGGRSRERHLARLSRWGLVRRLDRRIGGPTPGSSSYVYALDVSGQRLVGTAGPAGGGRLQRPWTPSSPYLRHAVLVSEIYVIAADITRAHPAPNLHDFQAEPACWRKCPGISSGYLKPDAYLALRGTDYEDSYFIEMDCGTESPSAIIRKLNAYQTYWQSGQEQTEHGVFPRVLFVTTAETRREQLRTLTSRHAARKLFAVVTLAGLAGWLVSTTADVIPTPGVVE